MTADKTETAQKTDGFTEAAALEKQAGAVAETAEPEADVSESSDQEIHASKPTSNSTDTPAKILDGQILRVASVVVLGVIMSILDITVVSVALPTFQQAFGASYTLAAWTMTAYTLALTAVIPLSGWAADRFGTKRLYLLALACFVLGSALCSVAWDITSLILFRVVQGLGGGMLMPIGMTIMTKAAGPKRVGRIMSVMGIPMLMGPIAGPILGGWMIQSLSWGWIFLINVPVGALALVLALRWLPKDEPSTAERFDFLGMLLLSPGLTLLLFGVSSLSEQGGSASSPQVLIPVLVGAALMVGFVVHALRKENSNPLIDLRLFQNGQLRASVITMFTFGVAFFGAMLLIPSYLLQIRGESTLWAGLLMAPQGLASMLSMNIAGRLVDRMPPGRIVLVGLSLILIGMGGLTQLEAGNSFTFMLPFFLLMGLGMGATMMPTMAAAQQTFTASTVARGSTLMSIVHQAASSVGSAVIATLLTQQIKDQPLVQIVLAARTNPEIAALLPTEAWIQGLELAARCFTISFSVAFLLVAASLVAAWFLPRKRERGPA